MSEATEQLKEKHGAAVAKLFETIELIPEAPLIGRDRFDSRSKKETGRILDIMVANYARIVDSLIYGNNFIGNDYFILRYCTYEMLVYWRIITDEQISETEVGSCKLEIETFFYLYLNCIYNLKEKFEALVGFKEGKLGNVVLTIQGRDALLSVYKKAYSALKRHCQARADIVHGTYEIKVWEKQRIIRLSTAVQDLLSKSDLSKRNRHYKFPLDDSEIIRPVRHLFDLTRDVVSILVDLDNVDPNKLAKKYVRYAKGSRSISLRV
jgi:hypothetical protein